MNFHTFKKHLKLDVNLVVIVLMMLLTNSNSYRMQIIFVRIGCKAATVESSPTFLFKIFNYINTLQTTSEHENYNNLKYFTLILLSCYAVTSYVN